jgi:hypothetical protein
LDRAKQRFAAPATPPYPSSHAKASAEATLLSDVIAPLFGLCLQTDLVAQCFAEYALSAAEFGRVGAHSQQAELNARAPTQELAVQPASAAVQLRPSFGGLQQATGWLALGHAEPTPHLAHLLGEARRRLLFALRWEEVLLCALDTEETVPR